MDETTTPAAEKGRPSALMKTGRIPPVSYVYGLHSGDNRYVYVGISSETPQQRLSVFKSPSSVRKGQPNRRTNEWIREHFTTVVAETLAILRDADHEKRRTVQLEWLDKLTAEGHKLLNSEIAGSIGTRVSRKDATKDAIAVERLKPVEGEHLAVLTNTMVVNAVLGRMNPGIAAMVPKHVQWHIKFNRRDIDCILCATEPEAWRSQATPFATKEQRRLLGKRVDEMLANSGSTDESAEPVESVDRAVQKTTVATVAAAASQARRAAATVASVSGPAAQVVEFVGIEAHQGTLEDLGFDPDGERDDDTGHLKLSSAPLPTFSSGAARAEKAAKTVADVVSKSAGHIRQGLNPSPPSITATERELALESAVRDVLKELKFLVEFLENEL